MNSARDMSVVPLLRERSAESPDRVFASFADGSSLSYGELATEAWTFSAGLRSLGLGPGDFVGSWHPNGRNAVRDFFANLSSRAVHTPLNSAYRGRLLEHALNVSGAAVLSAHPKLVSRLAGLDLPSLRYVVTDAEAAGPLQLSGVEIVDERELVTAQQPSPDETAAHGSENMAMVFTSGTTGPSKGVLQSYFYYERLAQDFLGEVNAEDRYYHCLPPFHQGALVALYRMLSLGASLFVRDGFRGQSFWEEVRSSGSTCGLLIGGMANFLMKQSARDDDSVNPMRTARVVPIIPNFKDMEARFDLEVTTCYGMTEIGTPFTSYHPDNGSTCGKLNEGFHVRLVDSYDMEVAEGSSGELVVRHDDPWTLNSGYKDMPRETADAWRNGWFHTGDIFRRDEQGNYYYVDRRKDAIRRRGENISSMELENEVVSHPAVLEAAAVPVPGEHADDEVFVVLVLQPGAQLDHAELTDFLAQRLPHFMVPRYLRVVDELPKTPTNKVIKAELRETLFTDGVWDREAEGVVLKREVLS